MKSPLKSTAILNIEKNDKSCFICSILAHLHPCESNHPTRVKNCGKFLNELTTQGFHFFGFKCSDVRKFEKLNNLSINIFLLNFYQDQNKWKQKISPIDNDKMNQIKLLTF